LSRAACLEALDTTKNNSNIVGGANAPQSRQESCAVARKLRDATPLNDYCFGPWAPYKYPAATTTTTVLFGLKLADNIHYKFKSSQASKAWLQSSKHWRKTEFNAKWPF